MNSNNIENIFFDLGDTLGSAVVGGNPRRLIGFDLFPDSLDILSNLKAQGLRLGVISNTGNDKGDDIKQILEPTGILSHLDARLLVYSGDEGVTKASKEIFDRAAKRVGYDTEPGKCLFVGEDISERSVAASAGWQVCPHPLLVEEVLAGQSLQYVRISELGVSGVTHWKDELQKHPLVPQHFSGARGTTVYAVTSSRVADELEHMGFKLKNLGEPDLPLTTDLYLLRGDRASESGFLSTTKEGVFVALPSDIDGGLDAFQSHTHRHGDNLKLTPDHLLFLGAAPTTGQPAAFTAGQIRVPDDVSAVLAAIDPAKILSTVKRYSGESPLDGIAASPVEGRHFAHPDNQRVVDQLVADLETIGRDAFQVSLQRFTYAGKELYNIEAELSGVSDELVLITAHLDSTEVSPGADDDASGMAAVLAIAEQFAKLKLSGAEQLDRTVRFVLFNAEEEGLVGSAAYARRSKARKESIVAVLQMDMIGYNKVDPRSWEVHAGFEQSPSVEEQSRRLAGAVRSLAPQISPTLSPAQLYHSKTAPNGDPAAGRSDHASFHAHGYPAIVVSEDFFVGPGVEAPEANPNYHKPGDTFIDEEYAAEIARAVAAASWVSASKNATETSFSSSTSSNLDTPMPTSREFDIRQLRTNRPYSVRPSFTPTSRGGVNALTGTPKTVTFEGPMPTDKSLVDRALSFINTSRRSFGFSEEQAVEFVSDPAITRTSAGSPVVNLKQQYHGLPVFQMTRTVRFDPNQNLIDAVGDNALIQVGLDLEEKLTVEAAVLYGANFLATSDNTFRDVYSGKIIEQQSVDVSDFNPKKISGFPYLPSKSAVLEKGPFEKNIPASLLIFQTHDTSRLAWRIIYTFPGETEQYKVLVAADGLDGEILLSENTAGGVVARGNIFEFSPGIADRRMVDFPRPLENYQGLANFPLTDFPQDWVSDTKTMGNSTLATLNTTSETLSGQLNNGIVEFNPTDASGDDQKLLNIFYFCSYIHDILYILGFDEASGNFQQVNIIHTGGSRDPVRARAHSGEVYGTANMLTGADGLPPLMNMGVVASSGRHTAFDADVVFHEYVHGLTNRLVGGRLDPDALDKLQSGGMGEGWSDYYALTIQSFFLEEEKIVSGDWVVNNSAGIRRSPYDDDYKFGYGDLRNFPEVHDIGEVWCATLMMMTRRIRTALGNKKQGYRLGLQMVTDGLKLTRSNPTFLDGRDAILLALDDLGSVNRIGATTHTLARKAALEAFYHFGMGPNASSSDANRVDDIVADLPPDGI